MSENTAANRYLAHGQNFSEEENHSVEGINENDVRMSPRSGPRGQREQHASAFSGK